MWPEIENGCQMDILSRINHKIESILSRAVVHNPTRFRENRLKTFSDDPINWQTIKRADTGKDTTSLAAVIMLTPWLRGSRTRAAAHGTVGHLWPPTSLLSRSIVCTPHCRDTERMLQCEEPHWRDVVRTRRRGRLWQQQQLTWRRGLIVSSLLRARQLTSAHFAEPVLAGILRRFQLRPATQPAPGANPSPGVVHRRFSATPHARIVNYEDLQT